MRQSNRRPHKAPNCSIQLWFLHIFCFLYFKLFTNGPCQLPIFQSESIPFHGCRCAPPDSQKTPDSVPRALATAHNPFLCLQPTLTAHPRAWLALA